ncbi:hypothetical protein THAOC_08686, partial [Thalassiosira oceanica]
KDGVKYAILLSGGVDSSLICRIVADEVYPDSVHAFTVTCSDSKGDDSAYASLVAKECENIEHHIISFTTQEAIDILPKVVECLESSDGNISEQNEMGVLSPKFVLVSYATADDGVTEFEYDVDVVQATASINSRTTYSRYGGPSFVIPKEDIWYKINLGEKRLRKTQPSSLKRLAAHTQ